MIFVTLECSEDEKKSGKKYDNEIDNPGDHNTRA